MLAQLRIRDFVLIDELDLRLRPGFNVLTGETGAGKSLIATALDLLLGRRGSGDLVRRGAQTAEIEGLFDVSDEQDLKTRLEEAGLPADDELMVRRIIPANGKHRCYLNGKLVSLSMLQDISTGLASIMSQHEHHSLTDPAKQLDLLDGFGKLEQDLIKMALLYKKAAEGKAALNELQARRHDRASRLDYLSFQLDEIKRVDPKKNEMEELDRTIQRLKNSERLSSSVKNASLNLYEEDGAVYDKLGAVIRDIQDVSRYDSSLQAALEQLIDAAALVEEAARFFVDFGQAENQEDDLVQLEDRLDELKRLIRKHSMDLDGILELKEQLALEIQTLSKYDEALTEAQAESSKRMQEAVEHASIISQKRKGVATRLAKAVTSELKDLALGKALFDVALMSAVLEPGPSGADRVEFMVRLNEGEGTHPISKVASGGELSRLMLALKKALLGVGPVSTYVFDEVDAGIGGAVAASVGRKLKEVAVKHQVICITHLPQIAAMADAHFMVSKKTAKGRTATSILDLDAGERVEELSRMLGGEVVTDKTREAAKELIKAGTGFRN